MKTILIPFEEKMTKIYKIAVIEGDGIGHEIVPQALEVAPG